MPGRHQLQDPAATGLAQLGDRVGGVISPHPAQHPGHLGVAHLPEQPVRLVRVQLLEHIGLEFGVGVDPVQDFPALVFVGVLQQVGDLRRFQGAYPSANTAGEHTLAVPDQRLEGLPVPARVPTPGFDQTEEPGRAAGVEAGQHPPGSGVFQLDVIGMHQLRRRDVDQAVIEHIRAQQHLPVAALEPAQIHLVLREVDPLLDEHRGLGSGHIHLATADADHQTGHRGIDVFAAQPDDDVLDPAHRLPVAGNDRAPQQPRQMDHRSNGTRRCLAVRRKLSHDCHFLIKEWERERRWGWPGASVWAHQGDRQMT